ncbi:hypothetical protein HYX18_02410, partial [Candidatus Woesearchaeota archaeon]|nr:hypothetical protein [Candidatus Woesearchaeota archaeon]
MVKLNKSRIKWLIKQVKRNNKKPIEVATVYDLSTRRVQQLVKRYMEEGKTPELNKNRRPRTFLTNEQKLA